METEIAIHSIYKISYKKTPKYMQHILPAYLRYSHEVDSCCTFFDVVLLSLISFGFKVPLDLVELLSLKLNNLLHNFGVDVMGELPLASGNKPIMV